MPIKKTHEEFVLQLKKVNADVEVLGKYINARTPVKCLCLKDNYQWDATPDNLLRGCGCPKCAGKRRNTKKLQEELKSKNPTIKIIGKYKNRTTEIQCICVKHNLIINATPSDLLRGRGCKKCGIEKMSDAKKMTNEEFLDRMKKINSNIDVIGKYINAHTNIKIKCKLCHKRWESMPNTIFSKGIVCTCQQGKQSKGETKISEVLSSYGIKHFSQYSYNGLIGINGGLLSYDFYLPDYNTLIEFQGEQHYKPCDIFGGEEKFKYQSEHDLRKRLYAKTNGIKLLEIKYSNYVNITSIIEDFLDLKKTKYA